LCLKELLNLVRIEIRISHLELYIERFLMNKKHLIAVGIVVGAFLVAALCFFIGADNKPILSKGLIDVDSGYRLVMGTLARVVVVAADSNTAKNSIETAFEQLQTVETLMSAYRADSEISKINSNAYNASVRVSRPTFEVLQKAIEFSKLSEGAFDITIGALVGLWRSASQANSVPTDDELLQARSKVNYEKLILDANQMSVRFAIDGMKLDLGGIAKGYAIDKAVGAMKKYGAIGGMVDVGGDIRCFGAPRQDKEYWVIGLQDPSKTKESIATDQPLLTLNLTDAAVATSGNYRRFALIEGKKYSHIIDTQTGRGSKGLASVTIISMGLEKGLTMIERIPGIEAILISAGPEFKRTQSSGVEKYIRNKPTDLAKAQK